MNGEENYNKEWGITDYSLFSEAGHPLGQSRSVGQIDSYDYNVKYQ